MVIDDFLNSFIQYLVSAAVILTIFVVVVRHLHSHVRSALEFIESCRLRICKTLQQEATAAQQAGLELSRWKRFVLRLLHKRDREVRAQAMLARLPREDILKETAEKALNVYISSISDSHKISKTAEIGCVLSVEKLRCNTDLMQSMKEAACPICLSQPISGAVLFLPCFHLCCRHCAVLLRRSKTVLFKYQDGISVPQHQEEVAASPFELSRSSLVTGSLTRMECPLDRGAISVVIPCYSYRELFGTQFEESASKTNFSATESVVQALHESGEYNKDIQGLYTNLCLSRMEDIELLKYNSDPHSNARIKRVIKVLKSFTQLDQYFALLIKVKVLLNLLMVFSSILGVSEFIPSFVHNVVFFVDKTLILLIVIFAMLSMIIRAFFAVIE